MAKDDKKPGIAHSFLGGLILTIVLVIVVPVLTAWLVRPIIEEQFGDVSFSVFTSDMVVGALMLLVMILFLILLGGGKIFKKYGIIGVIGLIIAYWLLGNVWDAVLPILIILLMTGFSFWRESKKK
jgi:hypothetical protein